MTKKYSSPLCSCTICKEIKSSKGINSHFNAAHTEIGKNNIKKAGILGSNLGAKNTAIKFQKIRNDKISEYDSNPNYCSCCKNKLEYDKRNNKFCSSSCSAKITNKKRIVSEESNKKRSESLSGRKHEHCKIEFKICKFCNQNFIWKQKISKSKQWCSDECISAGRSLLANNNPGLGTKRSKHEILLFDLCKNYFNKVSNNEKIFNGWDADILIHDLKYAILWNGPWHYREMNFGNHSLKQVQNRDKIKINEIKKAGWIPIIFEDRYYTPESAFLILIGEPTQIRTETMPC